MIAEAFTKALTQAPFDKFINAIMTNSPLEVAEHSR
jgi:hypothetical protein